MTKDKAIEAMDRLNAAGYAVTLYASPGHEAYIDPKADVDGRQFRISITELGVDKIDLRALIEIADELELDVGTHRVAGQGIMFTDQADPVFPVVSGPRRHPR